MNPQRPRVLARLRALAAGAMAFVAVACGGPVDEQQPLDPEEHLSTDSEGLVPNTRAEPLPGTTQQRVIRPALTTWGTAIPASMGLNAPSQDPAPAAGMASDSPDPIPARGGDGNPDTAAAGTATSTGRN